MSFQDLDFAEIQQSPEFAELSSMVIEITENDPFTQKLSGTQVEKLRSLVNAVITKATEGHREESDVKGFGVIRLVAFALFLLSKQDDADQVHTTVQTTSRVEVEILRERITEMEQQRVFNARTIENDILSRIAEQLSLNEPEDEDELVNVIREKMHGKKKLLHEVIKAFDLPEMTHASHLVSALEFHFQEKFNSVRKPLTEDTELANALREELLKITNELRESQDALDALKMKLEKRNKQIERLKAERDDTQKGLDDAIRALNERSTQRDSRDYEECVKFEALKAELLKERHEKDKQTRKIEKQASFIHNLENQVAHSDNENQRLTSENKALKQQINKMRSEQNSNPSRVVIERPDMTALKQKIETQEEENRKLMNLCDTMTSQFEKQAVELMDESKSRFTLVTAVQRLASVNHQLEAQLEIAENRTNEVIHDNEMLQAQIQEMSATKQVEKSSDESIFDNAISCADTLPENIKTKFYHIIHDDENTISNKISQLVSLLVNEIQTPEPDHSQELDELRNNNERLRTAVWSQLRFIEHLADSGDVQAWVLKSKTMDEVRPQLLSQCARIESFLLENGVDSTQKADLFDHLMLDTSPIHLKTNLEEFLEDYSSPSTEEGKELFVMLLQALTANVMLQKFCEEARSRCERLNTEVNGLRNEDGYTDVARRLQEQFDLLNEERDVVQGIRNRIMAVLHEHMTDGYAEFALACIKQLKENLIEPCTNDEYTQKLEQKCLTTALELEKYKAEHSQIATNAKEELEMLKEEIEEVKERSKQKIQEQEVEIERLKGVIEQSKKEMDGLQMTVDELTAKNDQITKEYENAAREFGQEHEAVRQEYDGIVRSLRKEMKLVEKGLEKTIQVSDNELQQLHASTKKKLGKINAELAEERAEKKRVAQYYREQIGVLQHDLDLSQERQTALQELTSRLKSELSEAKSKIAAMSVERRVLDAKLLGVDEKVQREKALYESQMKLKLFSVESESQAKIDAFKTEYNAKMTNFMVSICQMFKEMADMSQPINPETILALLQKVRNRLKRLDQTVFENEQADLELQSIRQITGASQNSRISTVVSDIMKSMREKTATLQKLESENESMKEELGQVRTLADQDESNRAWDSWARKLHSLVCDGFTAPSSSHEVRHAVEEVVLSSMGNRLMWRRLDCLRAEKKILLSGLLNVKTRRPTQTMNSVIAALVSIRRLQKLSGHVTSSFGFRDTSDKQPPRLANHTRTPLFGRFVVDEATPSRISRIAT